MKEIGEYAFFGCIALTDVECGERLETIGHRAFHLCLFLRSIKMPTVRNIEAEAFGYCKRLTDVEFGSNLERFEPRAFCKCRSLRRIAIPLKDNIIFPVSRRDRR